MHLVSPLADRLQLLEFCPIRIGQKPPVKEGLRDAQNNLSVYVVLNMLRSLITNAHGTVPLKSRQMLGLTLGEIGLQPDPIDRLNMAAGGLSNNVPYPAHIVLKRAHGGQSVQGSDREIGIPDPAIAVIPVARRALMFGQGCGQGGNDPAGFLVDAQFQGNRRPDDRILPIHGRGKAPRPLPPIGIGPVKPVPSDPRYSIGQRFVRIQNKRNILIQQKRRPI